MTYLLDTNTCVGYLNGTAEGVLRQLRLVSPSQIFVCSIVKAELFFGAMKSRDPAGTLAKQRNFLDRFLSLPFEDSAAEVYGEIRAHLSRQGTPIGPNDLLIAAIAVTHQATLVTSTTREFARVPGLALADWEAG